jgi:putative ABC transport system permease protein
MGAGGPWITVIGIVADVHHRGLDEPPRTEMYRPHTQFRYGGNANAPAVSTMTWVLRTTADPLSAAGYARSGIRAVDRDLGISDVATMTQVMNDATSDRRLDLVLFALLGSLALALATVGVYGVVAYSVTQRTHEIGVRMALGASRRSVLTMMLRQVGSLTLAGIVAGIGGALLLARSLASLLFGVSATDPSVYAGVSLVLALVALAAVAIPSSRATRVDPLLALREP